MSRQGAVGSQRAVVRRFMLGCLTLVLIAGTSAHATDDSLSTADSRLPSRHDTHVTLTRMAVDSSAVIARIRLFHDDLQLGLMKYDKLPKLELRADSAGNAMFARYLAERVWVEADGKRLAGTVQASGVETDTQGQPIIWYVIEYDVTARPKQLGVRNDLLFEAFPSQQNIVNVLDVPSGKRFSFYFVPGNEKVQETELR